MWTTPETAEAWIIPNHIRIINIDTSIPIAYWEFPTDTVNYTTNSIQYIHSNHEYALLNQTIEAVLSSYAGNIKAVVDISWRRDTSGFNWYIFLYQFLDETWSSWHGLQKIKSHPLPSKLDAINITQQVQDILR
jgi:hypothetical protein